MCSNAGLKLMNLSEITKKYYSKIISINNPVDEKNILLNVKIQNIKNNYLKKNLY